MLLRLFYILILINFVSILQPALASAEDAQLVTIEISPSKDGELILSTPDLINQEIDSFLEQEIELEAENEPPPAFVRVFAGLIRGAAVGTVASLSYYASTHDLANMNIADLILSAQFWSENGSAGVVGAGLSGTLSAFNNELQKFYDDNNRLRAIFKSFSVEYFYIFSIVAWSQYLDTHTITLAVIPLTSLSLTVQGFWGQTFGELALASATRKIKKSSGKIKAKLVQALSDGVVLFLSSSTVGAQILLLTSKPDSDARTLGTMTLAALTTAGITAYLANLYHDKKSTQDRHELRSEKAIKSDSRLSSMAKKCGNIFRKLL